ncbi:MAG: TonB-dependent receptor [Sphingobacteriia bacterium]|nr:TonB-dependent receptor [Sphingobacteriia bacterium]
MKFTAILLLVTCLHVGAKSYSQISLKEQHAPLEKVLKEIKKQSGLSLVYEDQLLLKAKPVDISIANATVEQALTLIFKDQPLSFEIIAGKIIHVKEKPASPKPEATEAVAPIQNIDVHGRVEDEKGEPLNGATVRVKGTEKVAVTNADGVFKIQAHIGDVLIVSFVGFETKEIKASAANMSIVLSPSQSELDKIQIIAYGTTTKRYNIGNVTTVKADDIKNQPVGNVLSALQGLVPGLEISNNSGDPGAVVNARIRGINSVSNIRGVLVLIDGAPGDLSTIPPADIASIDVLKDASATAIYGARGSDGVIIITTKKGLPGSGNKIRFSAYNSLTQPTKIAKVLNADQYRMIRKEAFRNDNLIPNSNTAPDLFLDSTVNTDWGKSLYKNSLTQDYQLNFSGGNAGVTYYLSGGYRRENAIVQGNWYQKKANVRLGIDAKMFRGFTVGGGLGYINANSNLYSGSVAAPIYYALPMIPFKDTLGNNNLGVYYPYFNPNRLLTSYTLGNNNQMLGNVYLNYNIWDRLILRADVNYQVLNGKTTGFSPTTSNFFPSTSTSGTYGNSSSKTLNFEPQLSYDKNFGDHYLKLLVGSTLLSTNTNVTNIYTYTPVNGIDQLNTVTSGTVTSRTYTETPYRFNSIFGRLNYNFKNRYLFEGVVRRDGSSRFGPDNQFGNFFSIGAGWLFSEEPAIKHLFGKDFFGKLRANYGTTGNDNIQDFRFLASSTIPSNGYNGNNTIYVSNIANPDIRWEQTKKLDIGLDLSLFHSRLTLSADYYKNRTTNTLFSRSLSYVAGYNGFTSNLGGIVDNTGADFSLNYKIITGSVFKWTTQFNFSMQKNKLVSLPGLDNSSVGNRYTYKVGEPLALNWGFKYQGVDPATGLAKFQDVDNNGVIASYTPDWQVIGKTIPDYYGGWNNQIIYKKFDMQVFTQFVGGITKSYNIYSGIGDTYNLPLSALGRWQKPGDITDVPRAAVPGTAAFNINKNLSQSDFAYSNASYIRVKNITLGYTFSGEVLKHAHVNSVRVYMTGYNLFTISKFKGSDPENGASFVPMTRMYTLGLNVEL